MDGVRMSETEEASGMSGTKRPHSRVIILVEGSQIHLPSHDRGPLGSLEVPQLGQQGRGQGLKSIEIELRVRKGDVCSSLVYLQSLISVAYGNNSSQHVKSTSSGSELH